MLREALPDIALPLSFTELSNVAQLFLSKTQQLEGKEDSKEGAPVEDRLVAAVSKLGLSDNLDRTLLDQNDSLKAR